MLRASLLEGFQVLFPFHRQQVLFSVIAVLAGGHEVPFLAFSSPRKGDHMIHRESFPPYSRPAVITKAGLNFSAPPVGAPEAASLFLFSPDLFFV